ncbi:MAG: FAD:protein FMN transferase, partial [Psychrobacter sp.]|nr:FAD:protein FMN transferase [Psychrobacter sp.]
LADAWATALTAMPYQQALDVAQKQNLAAMFVVLADTDNDSDKKTIKDADNIGKWQVVQTPAMQALRADKPL